MVKRLILLVLIICSVLIGTVAEAQTGKRIADCEEVDTFGQWEYIQIDPIWPVAVLTRISRRYVIWDIWQANFYNQMGFEVEGEDYLQGLYIASMWGEINGQQLESWTVYYFQNDYYVIHDSGCVVGFDVVFIMADWDDEIQDLYGELQ